MTPAELKTWRKSLGWSQQKAASALGISRFQILRYEHGTAVIPKLVELAIQSPVHECGDVGDEGTGLG